MDEENERWAEELMPSNDHYLTMLQFIVSYVFFNFNKAILLPYFASPAILNPALENVDGFPVNEYGDFRGYASSESAPAFLA